MKDDDRANHVGTYRLSPEQLDRMFDCITADLINKREARQRAEAWPHNVAQALLAAAGRVRELESRVAALEAVRV